MEEEIQMMKDQMKKMQKINDELKTENEALKKNIP